MANAFPNESPILQLTHPSKDSVIVYSLAILDCKIKKDSLNLNRINGKLNLLDKFYYDFKITKQDEKELFFFLEAAKNLKFRYLLEKGKCSGNLFLEEGDKLIQIKNIELEFRHQMGFPTLKKMHLYFNDRPIPMNFNPQQLEGHIPFYEFGFGVVANIHSNIRPHDTRRFNKDNLVVEPLPTFLIRYGPLFANRDGAGALLLPLKNFTLLGTVLLEGEPYESDFIRARKRSIYVGPLLKINILELLYYKDVRSISHGSSFKLTLAPEFKINESWLLNPRISYQRWDENYVDYYFNVSAEEANYRGFKEYRGRATDNYAFNIINMIYLKKWSLLFSFGYKFYGQGVSDSPLATKDNELKILTGLIYNIF